MKSIIDESELESMSIQSVEELHSEAGEADLGEAGLEVLNMPGMKNPLCLVMLIGA